jgi:hypothetical protein
LDILMGLMAQCAKLRGLLLVDGKEDGVVSLIGPLPQWFQHDRSLSWGAIAPELLYRSYESVLRSVRARVEKWVRAELPKKTELKEIVNTSFSAAASMCQLSSIVGDGPPTTRDTHGLQCWIQTGMALRSKRISNLHVVREN